MSAPKLRSRVEMWNSSSRVKLSSDPTPDMAAIATIAQSCLRYHPTLALDTWKSSLRMIREALENVEDIYDRLEDQ